MDLKKLQGKQWLYPAFLMVIAGLFSLMWSFFPILMVIAGFLMFFWWFQKYGKVKPGTPPSAKPPATPVK